MKQTVATVQRRALSMLVDFASTDRDIRYRMTGIHLVRVGEETEQGILAIATDGHTLALFQDECGAIYDDDYGKGITLSMCKATGMLRRLPKKDEYQKVTVVKDKDENDLTTWTLTNRGINYRIEHITALFPDYRGLHDGKTDLRYKDAFHAPAFSGEYLERVSRALKRYRYHFQPAIQIFHQGANGVALMMDERAPEFRALVMPIRVGNTARRPIGSPGESKCELAQGRASGETP